MLRGAAERDLRIAAVGEIEELPSDLRRCVVATEPDAAEAVLRRAKVLVGADPLHGSPLLAPPVIFDAAACGAAVITPHDFASLHDFAVGGTLKLHGAT